MNASDPDGNFGLWYIANAGGAHPARSTRVTDTQVDLDATSAAAWIEPLTRVRPRAGSRS